MTGRISMRPPGVFTFNNFSAEAVEKPIVAPNRYQHWIDKISAERLEANFSEMFERAERHRQHLELNYIALASS